MRLIQIEIQTMALRSVSSHRRIFCTRDVLLLLLMIVLADSVSAQDTEFQYSANIRNITEDSVYRQGSCQLTPGGKPTAICLTPQGPQFQAVSGRAFHRNPVRLSSTSPSNSNLSFSTMFSFNTLVSPSFGLGDGFVFLLSLDYNISQGGVVTGKNLGWLNSSGPETSGDGHNFGVEFDIFQDGILNDPDNNHVGINVNSLVSRIAQPARKLGLILSSYNSQELLYVWIDYDGQSIEVSMNTEPKKPCEFLIPKTPLDLQGVLMENMYVGFASSTGDNASAQTTIFDWSFASPGKAPNIYLTDAKCKKGSSLSWNLILGFVISVLCILLVLLVVGGFLLHRHTKKNMVAMKETIAELQELDSGPREYTYKRLSTATKKFSEKEVLGRGGFGLVYKGTIFNKSEGMESVVAIKRVSKTSLQGVKEFVAEVKVIGTLRHINLVRVLGWCYERGEMLLVYEYMPKGNLHDLLFPKDNGPVLAWEMRLTILRGVAAALVFLHEECEHRIVHRDIKSSNVLLDKDYNARLGDFGLSRLYERDNAYHETVVAGTIGYLAPECFVTGNATPKSDVYSFGVLALEVATGRKPTDKRIPGDQGLVKWVWRLHDEGKLLETVDVRLGKNYQREEMEKLLTIGIFCCLPEPEARPTMRQVHTVLQGEFPILSSKLPRAPSGLNTQFLDEDLSSKAFTSSFTNPFTAVPTTGSSSSSETEMSSNGFLPIALLRSRSGRKKPQF